MVFLAWGRPTQRTQRSRACLGWEKGDGNYAKYLKRLGKHRFLLAQAGQESISEI